MDKNTAPECYKPSQSPAGWCANRGSNMCKIPMDKCPYVLGKNNTTYKVVKSASGAMYPYRIKKIKG